MTEGRLPGKKTTSYMVRGKREFLQAYIDNDFHIGKTAKAISIPRRTINDWMQNDPDFRQRVEDMYELSVEIQIEEAEVVHRKIRNGIPKVETKKVNNQEVLIQTGWTEKPNLSAIEFYLRTKGRHKGYGDEPTVPGVKSELMTKEQIMSEIERLDEIFKKKDKNKQKYHDRKNEGPSSAEAEPFIPEA